MSYGYSQNLAYANMKASAKSLGVALGRVCIRSDVSVASVAEKFGVSRMTIYNWFKGDAIPHANYHSGITKYIDTLKNNTK